jgi:hypothetical protein
VGCFVVILEFVLLEISTLGKTWLASLSGYEGNGRSTRYYTCYSTHEATIKSESRNLTVSKIPVALSFTAAALTQTREDSL